MTETGERRVLRVAAAVLIRGDGCVLLAQRLPGTPYPGYWEFPGGKLESGESPLDALRRELDEELGITVTRPTPWLVQHYDYPHARVELHFFRVFDWLGEPHGRDGQAISWQSPASIQVAPLLPANAVVLRSLQLPPVYAISMAEDLGVGPFLIRAKAAMERDIRLIQLREKSFTGDAIAHLAGELRILGGSSDLRVLLNGDADTARALGCAGVHWTAARLMAAQRRPDQMMCAASCHDAAELARAAELGVDFVVLGPVLATPSHASARPLGWARFEELARGTPIPVYALGGLARADLHQAMQHGAHGVALRRSAWTADQDVPAPGSASSGSVGSSATGAR